MQIDSGLVSERGILFHFVDYRMFSSVDYNTIRIGRAIMAIDEINVVWYNPKYKNVKRMIIKEDLI